MPIETPRLILRAPAPGYGRAVSEAVHETWDDLHRWMDWATDLAAETPENKEIFCRENAARFILREQLPLHGFEKSSGRFVLSTGYRDPHWRARSFEVGYWVRKSAQGKGYATEATNALLRYAFNVLSARRVWITHSEGNEPSRRIIEKLGFAKEGTARQAAWLPDGSMADSHRYARLDLADLPPLDVKWV
jgi:RimJ/RimL family protein N-acetyltransferase